MTGGARYCIIYAQLFVVKQYTTKRCLFIFYRIISCVISGYISGFALACIIIRIIRINLITKLCPDGKPGLCFTLII